MHARPVPCPALPAPARVGPSRNRRRLFLAFAASNSLDCPATTGPRGEQRGGRRGDTGGIGVLAPFPSSSVCVPVRARAAVSQGS
jgi:hypothetical protein